jgi:GNAT superfamily N-acetyltransferase
MGSSSNVERRISEGRTVLSGLQLFQPDSVAQAIDLLRSSRPPVDSPTQRRYRSEEHLAGTFKHRLRRPEWVWAARRSDRVTGVIAALGPGCAGIPRVIDYFSDPGATSAERVDFTALAMRATEDFCLLGCTDVAVFCPPDVGFHTPAVGPLIAAFRNSGWEPLVARIHYEFGVYPGLGNGITTELRLEQLARADDERLLSVYPRVFAESLDKSHREAQNRLAFEAAWREALDDLLAYDPVECIRLAFDSKEKCVGIVSGRVFRGGSSCVMFVGVAEPFRGQGYGRQLLAAMTSELISCGATTLIADTDYSNVPMAKAFADVGWVQTESRLDLIRSANMA